MKAHELIELLKSRINSDVIIHTKTRICEITGVYPMAGTIIIEANKSPHEVSQEQDEYDNLKFHLWLGDEPIHDEETKELIGYNRSQSVIDFCSSIWASGESPLQRYLREKDKS